MIGGLFLNLFSALTEILLDLEAAIDSYDVPSDKGITKPGMYVTAVLSRLSK